MSAGRETKRKARRLLAEKLAIQRRKQQQKIYSNLLEIPDVCYRVPCLRRVE